MSEWIILAKIRRARGNRGEVAAESLTSGPDRFLSLDSCSLFDPSGIHKGDFVVEDAWDHQGQLILKFQGVDSINEAEQLRGYEVRIPPDARKPLPENEYYFGDLVGCQVLDAESKHEYGSVVSVHEVAGSHGLLEVTGDLLIPLHRDICVSVRPDEKIIEVRLPEGLTELNRS